MARERLINVRVTEDLHAAAHRFAEAQGFTVSDLVRNLLEVAIGYVEPVEESA